MNYSNKESRGRRQCTGDSKKVNFEYNIFKAFSK